MAFFGGFPKVLYDIKKEKRSNFRVVTNILFRLNLIKESLSNISAYYYYTITEDMTPEILAEKIYGDPTAYWILLYANDVYDPHYDWPMNGTVFRNYLADKYRSRVGGTPTDQEVINWTQTNYHHYEKVIRREDGRSGEIAETRFEVDYDNQTDEAVGAPYDTYQSLTDVQSVETVDLNGQTVFEIISRDAITYYDYEDQANEKRRRIKVIKAEYYPQIKAEYDKITNNALNPGLRKLK